MKMVMALVLALAALVRIPAAPAAEEPAGPVTVAIFDFEAPSGNLREIGPQVADLLAAGLSGRPGIRLVERAELKKVLAELGLGKTGIVAPDEAAEAGKVLGARVLVIGRVFTIDSELVIVARTIGTETTRVFADSAQGMVSDPLAPVILELGEKVGDTITARRAELAPPREEATDPVAELCGRLAGKQLPRVRVKIEEEHISRPVIDPAAETEFILILRRCGFEVVEGGEEVLSDWARKYFRDSSAEVPRALEDVDILIVGEAFSEGGGRTGNLVTAKGRLEVRALDAKTGKILAVDRRTETAVDLAESIAAKTALQAAARDSAVRIIPEMTQGWSAE
ncbi:MAG: CsgG/HfaB family protein [Candidatus Erginobacter occultus]|nr:CsgG/HfaB family protein [Candidatus Erginobacter occultus]